MVTELGYRHTMQVESERRQRMAKAWQRYHGQYDDVLNPAPDLDPGGEDNILLPWDQMAADTSASALIGSGLAIEVDDGKDAPPEPDNDPDIWLERVIAASGGTSEFLRMAVSGAVTGQIILRIHAAREAGGLPRFSQWDPQHVDVEWEPDDYNAVREIRYSWAARRADGGEDQYRQVVALTDGRWEIRDERALNGVRWEVTGRATWTFPWCPVVWCQNLPAPHCWWGKPDIDDATRRVVRGAHVVVSSLARILRSHASPRVAVFGATNVELDSSKTIEIQDAEGRIELIEMKVGGADAVMKAWVALREEFHRAVRIPEVVNGKVDDVGSLSGVALKLLFGPLIALVDAKRSCVGPMLETLAHHLLEMSGRPGWANFRVHVRWPDVVPSDARTEAETAILLQQAGVSRATTIEAMGYDAETEENLRAEERQSDADLGRGLLDQGDASGAGADEVEDA